MATQILISKDGEQRGPYFPEEINDLLAQGRLAPTDLAWFEGSTEWIPVAFVPGINASLPPEPAIRNDTAESKAKPDHPDLPLVDPIFTGAEEWKSTFGQAARAKACGAMADATTFAVEQFLAGFQRLFNADGSLRPPTRDEFFRRCILQAEKFTVETCREIAALVQQYSFQIEIRQVDGQALARRIRETSFAELDEVLLRLVIVLQELKINLRDTLDKLDDSRFREGVQSADPAAPATNEPGEEEMKAETPTASASAPAEATNGSASLPREEELMTHGLACAYSVVLDYLKAINRLPGTILDYGSTKCFGADVDFALQKSVLSKAEIAIGEKVTRAVEKMLNFVAVENRALEEQGKSGAEKSSAEDEHEASSGQKEAIGISCLVVSAFCLLPAWFIVLSGSTSPVLKTFAAIAGVVGSGCLFWGIVIFILKRAESERPSADEIKNSNQPKPPAKESSPNSER